MRSRIGLIIVLLLISSFGTKTTPASLTSPQTRALWVTRWDYQTPSDVKKIMENAAAAHFNTVLFQVRGNGTVLYPSRLEPWATELGGRDPGWDPLQLAVEIAHAYQLEIQAWVNVYPGWSGDTAPHSSQQLYHVHPEWFMIDRQGRRQQANDHYSFLSPTHPEVNPYLLSVCREILQNYAVDGLHLDYIRFPGPGFSWDQPSLQRFQVLHNVPPDENPEQWSNFRRSKITDFVAQLYHYIKTEHPQVKLTASVLGDYAEGYRVYLQDSHDWLARGIIDAIFPMLYTRNNERFQRLLSEHRLNDHGRQVFPGIYIAHAERLQSQLRLAEELGCQGVALFSYESLFPHHIPAEEFSDLLAQKWPERSQQSQMQWKAQVGDHQGPVIEEVYTLPIKLFANAKFKIAVRISDPSGVHDDRSGSEGQGVYLLYDRVWPPQKGVEVKLSKLKEKSGWYITDEPIPSQDAGLDFRFRIFAWDNFFESAGHPKRNLGYSDIWSLCILASTETYESAGTFGPEVWDPTALTMDNRHQIWLVTQQGRQLEIIDHSGEYATFSPITMGMNVEFKKEALASIEALAFCPPHALCVIKEDCPRLFRFDVSTGMPLTALELNFIPGQIASDSSGHLYITEKGVSRWHIFTSLGIELQGSPFGIDHEAGDIAVLQDGSRVFMNDVTTGGVQCWHGAIEGYRARYWQETDVPTVDVGWARMETDKHDFVYVPHSARGVISIFNRAGKPVEHLVGGTPALNAPRDIAVSAGSDSLFVIETVGSGSTKILRWVRKAK
jgi:uncharacterized lipoprotein YddW (UPF0748 family)